MNKRVTQFWTKYWPAIFFLASVIFIVRYFGSQAKNAFAPERFAWQYLALAFLSQLIYWAVNALCWRATIFWISGTKINRLQSFSQLAMAALGKYFPGKIWGMVARTGSLARLGVLKKHSVYATINEQFLLIYSAILVCCLLWLVVDRSIYTAVMLISVVAGLPVLAPLLEWIYRFVRRAWPIDPSYEDAAIRLGTAKMAALVASYCAIWLSVGLIFYSLYCTIFAGSLSWHFAALLVIANTIGISVGFFAVFTPGGLGVREAVTSSLLATQMNLEQAIFLCLAFRVWIVAFELLGGLTLLLPNGAKSKKSAQGT